MSSITVCAYCGQTPTQITRDHVVPRTLWGDTGLPPRTVTVPACIPCQARWDMQAGYFRNTIIAMIDKGAHKVANVVLEGPVVRSLERDPKAVAAFFRKPRMLPKTTPSGLFAGYHLSFQIDWNRFATVPEKIVRGLFYFKSQVPLDERYTVRVFQGNGFWSVPGFPELLSQMENSAGFGDDVFQVRSVRYDKDHNYTAWLLQFYQQIAFFAWTEPVLPQQQAGADGAAALS